MFKIARVCHVRYDKEKQIVHKRDCDDYSRIVTVAWNYYPDKNMLLYGATVYTPANKSDRWVKQDHADQARLRYQDKPVMIKFDNPAYFSRLAMDRYIADHLVYRFGVEAKVLDYVHHFKHDESFVDKYDPEYHILIRERQSVDQTGWSYNPYVWCTGILAISLVWGGLVMG